jgi:hypothetical protein
MNCKQGDLARIVGLPYAASLANDHFVVCAEMLLVNGAPSWRFERPLLFVTRAPLTDASGRRYLTGDVVSVRALADRFLRPIRDPGDDAVDQFARVRRRDETLTIENTR